MCGIAGYLNPTADSSAEWLTRRVQRMADALRHRGPDSDGVWVDEAGGIAFGHRRLSILDLSQAGAQPMHSQRYVIAYNGELYNYAALRADLEAAGYRFIGSSDTEVLLGAVETWGIAASLTRFVGMFAIALWDRQERRLHLIRDHLGIKPLYYGWGQRGEFLFGSELKALRAHPSMTDEVNPLAIPLLLRYAYIPAPQTIYQAAHKLPPGMWLTVTAGQRSPEIRPFWSLRQALGAERITDPQAALEELRPLLAEAVRLQLVSDVPLGAFLSGGLDSSTVVALMQQASSRPARTFTIGFDDPRYDESADAEQVARHLHTDHTTLRVSAGEALRVIPLLATIYDEPYADSSQIPTYLVSKLTRDYVTVALSGDGGDEVFGGYNRYLWADAVWQRAGSLPLAARLPAAGMLRMLSPQAWDRVFMALDGALPARLRQRHPGVKLHKLAGALSFHDDFDLYQRLASIWPETYSVTRRAAAKSRQHWPEQLAFRERMMAADTLTYLPDDILTKVDRASMSVSLEARVPLLDHRVVELAWRIAPEVKFNGGASKWLLRQIAAEHLPAAWFERPKSGFALPLADWLRAELRPWAESLLAPAQINASGWLNPDPIRRAWERHQSGRRDESARLWVVLMFQAWLEAQRAAVTADAI